MAWMPNWCRRKKHTINMTALAGTDYQIGIKVYKGAGADGIEVVGGITMGKVYCGGNCQNDFGDLRFTASDGTSLLAYWIDGDSLVAGTSCVFWVKVTGDITAGNVEIYVYYDTAGATATTSNFDNTFIFGDPLDNIALDVARWTSVDGNPTYTIDAVNHYLEVTDMNNGWQNNMGFHSKLLTIPAQYIIENAYSGAGLRTWLTNFVAAEQAQVLFSLHHGVWSAADFGVAFSLIGDWWIATRDWRKTSGVGGNHDWIGAITGGVPVSMLTRIWKLAGTIRNEIDTVLRVTEANAEVADRVHWGLSKSTEVFPTVRFYAFKIRKYASPEPVHNTWAGEETPTVLTPTNCAANCSSPIIPYAITMTWNDNATNETAYYVERDDGGWHVISGALPANTQTYIDNTVVCDTLYLYRVRAYMSGCGGIYSGYCTIGVAVQCACPITPIPPPPPTEEAIHHRRLPWRYVYKISFKLPNITADLVYSWFNPNRVSSDILYPIPFGEIVGIESEVARQSVSRLYNIEGEIGLPFSEEYGSETPSSIIEVKESFAEEFGYVSCEVVHRFKVESKVSSSVVSKWRNRYRIGGKIGESS